MTAGRNGCGRWPAACRQTADWRWTPIGTGNPDTWCLEVFSGAASKGRAAERLRALTGAERMAAFGDGHNDLSLFQVCEERYAVENAAPEVKAAADAVIRSNRADGVARSGTALDRGLRDGRNAPGRSRPPIACSGPVF